MSKKLLVSIIVFAGLALGGIIYVQLYYIKIAFEQNEIRFDQNVNNALQAFVDKLEQKETVEVIHAQVKKSMPRKIRSKHIKPDTITQNTFVFEFNDSMLHKMVLATEAVNANFDIDVKMPDTTFLKRNNSFRKINHNFTAIRNGNKTKMIQQTWSTTDDTVVYLSSDDFATQFDYKIDTSRIKSEVFVYGNDKNLPHKMFYPPADYASSDVFVVKKDKLKAKTEKVKTIMEKMENDREEKVQLFRKTIDYKLIDSLLNAALAEKDISLHYEYRISSGLEKVKGLPKSIGFDSTNQQKKYQTSLFPNDIIPKQDKIEIYFPDRQDHLMKSLSILLPSSLVFSLIVIVAFTISIMMVIRQKKISDIKSDFINNMTHEFKTPIATISLAADSIINPKVISDNAKVEHFTKIIKEENKRMNLQVERILQMSLLDRSEMDLNLNLLDINDVVQRAVEKMAMQVSKYNGVVSLNLSAANVYAMVDEIHFINVVHNLIDNALKYSIGIPEINISTRNFNNGIMLSVEDKGIGLSKEAQSKIFEKFYRVSKGNIHNIKGFGLGLSYVKAITEALGGRISVKSELNKGSRFDIYLPQKLKDNGKQA